MLVSVGKTAVALNQIHSFPHCSQLQGQSEFTGTRFVITRTERIRVGKNCGALGEQRRVIRFEKWRSLIREMRK